MRSSTRLIILFLAALGLAFSTACGDDGGTGGPGTPDGNPVPVDDAGNPIPLDDAGNPIPQDGGGGGMCDANAPQCSNCTDDDGDGDIDGQDVHCISAADDDESSFETGIPGDNMDATWQDCFFDGNSGAGDDGCRYHSCCLLPAGTCPDGNFDPVADCAITQECIDFCAPAAPPGCDCFGCCTICNDSNVCTDVIVNPAIDPDCDVDATNTPVNCTTCVPSTECGSTCDNSNCTLCPGQTPEDLPPECNMQNQCPDNTTACTDSTECGSGEFCLNSCCTPQIG